MANDGDEAGFALILYRPVAGGDERSRCILNQSAKKGVQSSNATMQTVTEPAGKEYPEQFPTPLSAPDRE
jgi:hypothetical protein